MEGRCLRVICKDPMAPPDLFLFLVGISYQGYVGIHNLNPRLEMSLSVGDLFGELKVLHEILSPANKMEQ